MEQLIRTVINWSIENWPAILALFGGGAAVSLTLEAVLHKFKIDSKKIAFTLLQVLGLLGSLAAYLIANQPTSDVPAVYASLVIAAQFMHRFLLSPVYNKQIKPFLEYKAAQKPLASSAATAAPTAPAPLGDDSVDTLV